MLRGPGLANVDAGFFKTIPVREQLQLQFRAEFFNFFNRANFNIRATRSVGPASAAFARRWIRG
jgi:hypothetical protein